MFSCMLWGHIVAGRGEEMAAESRCMALRCESVRRSLVSCADAGCDNTFDIVLFCNSSRLNSPNCRLQLVQSETADITVCRSFLQQLTQEFTRKVRNRQCQAGVSFEKFSVRSGELRISEILRMPVFTDWILYGLEDNP